MFLRLIVIFLFAASLTLGQSVHPRHRARASARRPHPVVTARSSELVRLAGKLRAPGATVAVTGEKVTQPFFSVSGRIIKLNGEALQVLEYASPSAADADASRVSADGTTIGTSKPTWLATPHFFKSGKVIVLYIGGNQTTINLLRTVLGNQFAGG